MDVLKRLGEIGLVPVIKIDDVEKAVPLAKALSDGGLPVAEVTFRTAEAEEAIRRISTAMPDMLVGAGTVLTIEQVKTAVGAGAKFIVSPGFNPKVVGYCIENNIPITPGCSNASDIEMAIEMGLGVVKFFPAEQAGGLPMLKALAAPYNKMKFIPTGGIDEKNLTTYLAFDKVVCCGGSFMVKEDLIKAGEWAKITELTQNAVSLMLGFEIAHIGINCNNEEEANGLTFALANIFGMPVKEGKGGNFTGSVFELLKAPYLGAKGHIAIKTNSIARGMAHLEAKGVKFNPDGIKSDEKGNLVAAYLAEEFGGFAIHLLQKK